MLDPKHRGTVSGMMTNKKHRKKSDQTRDLTANFFDEMVESDYLDGTYVVTPPAEEHFSKFPEEEKGSWDPNDPSIFEHKRDGAWLKGTWEECLRPKHKKALDRWNKETGGGDGTPSSFIDYCDKDRWLIWVFCKDYEANFLLASNAGGRMPHHLQIEAGFEETVSSLDDSSTQKREALQDELAAAKCQHNQLDTTMQKVCLTWIRKALLLRKWMGASSRWHSALM